MTMWSELKVRTFAKCDFTGCKSSVQFRDSGKIEAFEEARNLGWAVTQWRRDLLMPDA